MTARGNLPLPAMNMFMLRAPPHKAEPTANMTTNVRSTGFLPNTDTRPPTVGRIAVDAIVYALPAQMKSVPCKCSTIVGRAVDTAVCERVGAYFSTRSPWWGKSPQPHQIKCREEIDDEVSDEHHPECKASPTLFGCADWKRIGLGDHGVGLSNMRTAGARVSVFMCKHTVIHHGSGHGLIVARSEVKRLNGPGGHQTDVQHALN